MGKKSKAKKTIGYTIKNKAGEPLAFINQFGKVELEPVIEALRGLGLSVEKCKPAEATKRDITLV